MPLEDLLSGTLIEKKTIPEKNFATQKLFENVIFLDFFFSEL